ncbi:MAG: NUDIX domain-containing protein [Patescibacteria group bacterium]
MNISKNNQQVYVAGAIVFRDYRGKRQFLITKQKEGDGWEIPKVAVRKGESSVRAAIRMTGEQASMSARVLEEAGRSSAAVIVNGKPVPQKLYYYLMILRSINGEIMGFNEAKWVEYSDGLKKLEQKREKDIFKAARGVLAQWQKNHKNYKQEEKDDIEAEIQEEALKNSQQQ